MSQSYIESKKKAARDNTFKYIAQISKAISGNHYYPVCVYEGKDDIFYSHFFTEKVKTNHSSIVCESKKNVLSVFEEVKKNKKFKGYNIVYFIDRDFDDNIRIRSKSLFVTSGYAIENFYCTVEAFDRFIKAELNVQRSTDAGKYQKLKKEFYDIFVENLTKISDLNSWALFQRKNGKNFDCVNFANLKAKEILNVANVWEYLEKKFPNATKATSAEKSELAKHKIHKKPIQFYRGKWVFELYKQQIDLIINHASELLKQKKIIIMHKKN